MKPNKLVYSTLKYFEWKKRITYNIRRSGPRTVTLPWLQPPHSPRQEKGLVHKSIEM